MVIIVAVVQEIQSISESSRRSSYVGKQCRNESKVIDLSDILDRDLPAGWRRRLGHGHRQDTVSQARLDIVLVDAGGEVEGAVEFADGALLDPESVAVLISQATLLDLIGRRLASFGRRVFALDAALDHQRLRVGELDVDVLLVHAGQLAVQQVGVLGLAYVEARRPVLDRRVAARRPVHVIVVEEAEERSEVTSAWEERHCGSVDRGCDEDDFRVSER